jgi:hypothetical protein
MSRADISVYVNDIMEQPVELPPRRNCLCVNVENKRNGAIKSMKTLRSLMNSKKNVFTFRAMTNRQMAKLRNVEEEGKGRGDDGRQG